MTVERAESQFDIFEIDKYLRNVRPLDLGQFSWGEVARHPLKPEEARVLAYMRDIEAHTPWYQGNLLLTRAADDPEATAFLVNWGFQEYRHGEALGRFLGEAGYRLPPEPEPIRHDSPFPSGRARDVWIRRQIGGKRFIGHLATMIGSAIRGDFVAIHMMWGAVNELSTLTGYQVMIDTTDHPILKQILSQIMKDERIHFAYYRAQAEKRLAGSRSTQRMTRWAMEHLWAPVGTGVRPQRETDFVIVHLLGGEKGRQTAVEMDQTISKLPGFEGSRLIQRARIQAIRRREQSLA